MAYKADFKTTFEPSRVIQPIYTGGSVSLSQNGRILVSSLGDAALLTDLNTGSHLARIEGDGEAITNLVLTPDASYLVICSRSLSMRLYALRASSSLDEGVDASLVRTLKPHSTPVVTTAIDSTSSLLATGGADGEVKVWDISGGFVTHTFHGHSGVISALNFFEVTAEAESLPTKNKNRNSRQKRLETDEAPDGATARFRLASGGEDGKVRIWDLHKRKSLAILDSHVSVVRSIGFSPDQNLLLSASRDKTVILWDANTWKVRSTIAVLEGIEAADFVDNGRFFYTGGETARLRIWSTEEGSEVTQEQDPGPEIEGIVNVQYHPGMPFLLTVHADQTLVLRSLMILSKSPPSRNIPSLPILRRISGTHDEVIDLAYIGKDRNLLALATNLEDIRIISLQASAPPSAQSEVASPYFGADVALLKGHADIIITIDTDWSGHWLATGAKDNTAKLWRLDPEHDSYSCFATFTGHAESISAVSLPNESPAVGSKEHGHPLDHPPRFLITGSSDKTVKRWDIGAVAGKTPRAAYTRKAHDKDINAIETSYSSGSTLFASASQDRTVRIWDVDTGDAIGVLRGHKRGVWSVAFSPPGMPALTTTGEGGGASTARGMVVTGSGDKTVRIWSLTDYSCLRTFEGHANSILKVVWLPPPEKGARNRGVQVASAAGDGLVKIWDAQNSECAATLDNHIDRVWALAVKPPPILSADELAARKAKVMSDDDGDEEEKRQTDSEAPITLVSGSADSTLTFWADTTAATAQRATTQMTARVEQDQTLQNLIRASNFREAIVLALQLDHPRRLLEIFTAVTGKPDGERQIDEVITQLSDSQLWALLRRLRDWNANVRTHRVAQRVLYAVLRCVGRERLLGLGKTRKGEEPGIVEGMQEVSLQEPAMQKPKESVKDVLDGLKVYTERHYARQEKAGEELFVLTWVLQRMDDVSGMVSDGHLNGGAGPETDDVLMLDVDEA